MADTTFVLPPSLAKLKTKTGKHSAGKKILGWTKWKGGKSEAAASQPPPIFGLAIGEPGLKGYLDEKRGDVCLEIYTAVDMFRALDFAFKNAHNFPSVAIDNLNLGWGAHLTAEEQARGGEIKKHQWAEVKAPWFEFLAGIGRTNQNVFMTCWQGDIMYEKVEKPGPPGTEPKIEVIPTEVDMPKVEKHVPYYPDLIFSFDSKLDKKRHLTEIITVTFRGGRVPISVPTSELYIGKTWEINTKTDPRRVFWSRVIEPILPSWGEDEDAEIKVVGMSEKDAEYGRAEVEATAQAATVGKVLARIQGVADLKEFAKVFTQEIQVVMNELSEPNKAIVRSAKEHKKKELGG